MIITGILLSLFLGSNFVKEDKIVDLDPVEINKEEKGNSCIKPDASPQTKEKLKHSISI